MTSRRLYVSFSRTGWGGRALRDFSAPGSSSFVSQRTMGMTRGSTAAIYLGRLVPQRKRPSHSVKKDAYIAPDSPNHSRRRVCRILNRGTLAGSAVSGNSKQYQTPVGFGHVLGTLVLLLRIFQLQSFISLSLSQLCCAVRTGNSILFRFFHHLVTVPLSSRFFGFRAHLSSGIGSILNQTGTVLGGTGLLSTPSNLFFSLSRLAYGSL